MLISYVTESICLRCLHILTTVHLKQQAKLQARGSPALSLIDSIQWSWELMQEFH